MHRPALNENKETPQMPNAITRIILEGIYRARSTTHMQPLKRKREFQLKYRNSMLAGVLT